MSLTVYYFSSVSRILDKGFSYDASGNLTADGVNAMAGVYPERARKRASRRDAEQRMVSTSGTGGSAEYKYDAHGLRVKKCVPECANPTAVTISIYAGEQVIAEYNGMATPPSLVRELVYLGDQLLAVEENSARTYFLRDHLSVRVTTDSTGAKIGEQGHYPYGEDWYLEDATTERMFTNYQREAESGNDYAVHRYHASSLGRFTTADPGARRIGHAAEPEPLRVRGQRPGEPPRPAGTVFVGRIRHLPATSQPRRRQAALPLDGRRWWGRWRQRLGPRRSRTAIARPAARWWLRWRAASREHRQCWRDWRRWRLGWQWQRLLGPCGARVKRRPFGRRLAWERSF